MEHFPTNTQVHGHSLRSVFFFLVLYIGCGFNLFSQTPLSTSDKKAKKLYEKAEKSVKDRDFEEAISLFNQAVVRDPKFYHAYLRMGSLHNTMGNLDAVYVNFSKYLELTPNPSQAVLNRMAFMSFDRGDYIQSDTYLNSYLELKPEMRTEREIVLLQSSLLYAQDQLQSESDLNIEKLPESINRFDLQYLPAITIDNSTMIFTKRDFVNDDEDIVVSYFQNGNWTRAESISSRINSPLNEGACTISADGNTMIFTSCDRRDSFGSCDLYISRKSLRGWSNPKNVGKPINTHYWESQPSLSADGNTLYFSSNRTGGKGGRDLWFSSFIDEKWTKPINLGANVNSFKDETTPFIHPNNSSLYYSSNGFTGMGGFDLYQSSLQDSVWSSPINMGFPINTYRDEVALLIAGDGKTAYYAQESQKNNEIIDSDIVSFILPYDLRVDQASYIIGKVVNAETGFPLKADVEVVDVVSNESLFRDHSDSLSGEYLMVLPANRNLAGYVKKRGYIYSDFNFSSSQSTILESDTILIELEKVAVGKNLVLKNIYFEVDSFELDARSDSEIESVFELLSENPSIYVEISGHTDSTGSEKYNKVLSEKRAQTIYNELIKRGVESSRLKYKGYADKKPLKERANDFPNQSNRRIEFSVLRYE
ncbi:MAG: OmpA family protein [Ekhidna sp.]